MADHVIKMPDIGEGIAEAELVEWHVKEGDLVREDDDLAAVMTDKATVEIPSPVDGRIVWLGATVGQMVAVGSELIRIEVKTSVLEVPEETECAPAAEIPEETTIEILNVAGQKALASPAVRKKARDHGIELSAIRGTGPEGRIVHADLESWMDDEETPSRATISDVDTSITDIPVIGLRRKIAQKMSLSKSHIPHITIVEEIDVTSLEGLRNKLNRGRSNTQPKLSILPFVMQAVTKAIRSYPNMNARYDDEAGVIHQHSAVHIGIATHTASGLMVPVVRHIETRDVWNCAEEIKRLSCAARNGTAKREELADSTITVTSLGTLGGLMTTPIINYPEVAIIGLNKIQIRPVWDDCKFVPRKMMNLSSSFDHRVIDGWDAAHFVREIKKLLEEPGKILTPG